jgi:hypothetical protein
MGGFAESEPAMPLSLPSAAILDHFSALSNPRRLWPTLYLLRAYFCLCRARRCQAWRTLSISGCGARAAAGVFTLVPALRARHMAINPMRNRKDSHSTEIRRKLANLNPDCRETIIRQKHALT